MCDVDLKAKDHYPPLDAMSTEELFAFGVTLAKTLPNMRVRTPCGEEPDEAVTLDSRLLRKKGCEIF